MSPVSYGNKWLFDGWGLVLALTPLAVILAAVLALISTLWSRIVHTSLPVGASGNISTLDLVGWAFAVPAATGVLFVPSSGRGSLVLMVLLPQLLCYPLTRARPRMRPLWAAGLTILGALLVAIIGSIFGGAPD